MAKNAARFWISGVSKGVATLLTYPLIRAKVRSSLQFIEKAS